jgi:hypothetical protein
LRRRRLSDGVKLRAGWIAKDLCPHLFERGCVPG